MASRPQNPMEEREKVFLLFEAALNTETPTVIDALVKTKQTDIRFPLDVNECAILASRRGNAVALSKLLPLHPRMSHSDCDGKRAIHYASENGHLECVKMLLNQGAISNCSDNSGYTPLLLACLMGHVHVVRQLIQQGAHVNSCRTERGESAMHVAAKKGHLGVMAALLEHGGDVNIMTRKTKGGMTPLHKAVFADKPEMVEYLLKEGAHSNIADLQGKHPIHWACERGLHHCLSVLLRHNAVLGTTDSRGFSPLGCAIYEGQTNVALTLISHNSDLSAQACEKMSLLRMATIKGNLQVMECLVQAGADVNFHSDTEEPPLFAAVSLGKLEVVKKLLSLGANVNVRDDRDCTPLHVIGSRPGSDPIEEVVTSLLHAGSRLDLRDKSDATPIQKYLSTAVVTRQINLDCLQLLCQAGASLGPDEYRKGKSSPLVWLAYSGFHREALYLARAGWELQTELWILLPGKDDRQNMLHQCLLRLARTVPTLRSCCRKVIRQSLSESRQCREIISSIEILPLPVPLKNFLLLKGVDPQDDSALDGLPLQDIRPLYTSTWAPQPST